MLALTDLKSITFIRVKRTFPLGDFTYEISEPMNDVLGALCAVKRMNLAEVRIKSDQTSFLL